VVWSAGEQAEFAQSIEHEALRLNRLVGSLIDLARIEGGALRPDKEWYDLDALIDDLAGRLRPVLDTHQLRVAVQADLPPVALDYVEIDQVLSNLIEHALERSPEGATIQVRACLDDGHAVRIAVADAGPALTDQALAGLFEPFSHTSRIGLALAVARGLVLAHGGRIWAANRAEGGLLVSFTLPL
jgi:two-component system, OmpR family, sensor histidine kinase KdpD